LSGRARLLAEALPAWLRIAWWGLGAPRVERAPLLVVQAVVVEDGELLLAVRRDLIGWELPGGGLAPGEPPEAALVREVREETGLEIEIERAVGDYVRTGFRPHTARVWRCRRRAGLLRPSAETPVLRWFPFDALPAELFPWYRAPIEDALSTTAPVHRTERQGARTIVRAAVIDLTMRWRGLADGSGDR
jgi:ADP-ribose pyrophosphatase YjhB (NUDIX family)